MLQLLLLLLYDGAVDGDVGAVCMHICFAWRWCYIVAVAEACMHVRTCARLLVRS